MSLPAHLKRVKIADRLVKRGNVYYYRTSSIEERLGKFKTDAEAIRARDIFETLRSRIGSESFAYRVKDLWPKYFAEREEQLAPIPGRRVLSERTIFEMRSIWERHLSKFFANRKLADIDDPLWNEYCRRSKVSDLTNHRKVLKTFFVWCKINGKMRVVPEMQIPAVVRRKRRTLTKDEYMAILRHSKGTLHLFCALYLLMGVRRGEQLQLRWKYVNFGERSILIPDETTRTRKGRVIPINAYVQKLLYDREREQRDMGIRTPWVFPKRDKPSQHATKDAPSKAWRTMLKNAGLKDIEPHDLRATYEHFANKRADFTDTQREKMAGASIQTQRRIYLHGFQAEDLRGLEDVVAIDNLDDLIDGKTVGKPKLAWEED